MPAALGASPQQREEVHAPRAFREQRQLTAAELSLPPDSPFYVPGDFLRALRHRRGQSFYQAARQLGR